MIWWYLTILTLFHPGVLFPRSIGEGLKPPFLAPTLVFAKLEKLEHSYLAR